MIAKWLQQVFGGIFQTALNLMAAIFGGFLGAPAAAVAQVSVRDATPRDVDGVYEVVLNSKPLADGTRRYWAAERNGMVIGALTGVLGEDGVEIRDLAVLEQYDHREVGTALVKHVHAQLPGQIIGSNDLPGWPTP